MKLIFHYRMIVENSVFETATPPTATQFLFELTQADHNTYNTKR